MFSSQSFSHFCLFFSCGFYLPFSSQPSRPSLSPWIDLARKMAMGIQRLVTCGSFSLSPFSFTKVCRASLFLFTRCASDWTSSLFINHSAAQLRFPNHLRNRIITGAWGLAVVVISAYYCSVLTSFLVSPGYRPLVDSKEALADSNQAHPAVIKGYGADITITVITSRSRRC